MQNDTECCEKCFLSFAQRLAWCGQEGLNLHDVTHTALNRARLPIPPCPQTICNYKWKLQITNSNFQTNSNDQFFKHRIYL